MPNLAWAILRVESKIIIDKLIAYFKLLTNGSIYGIDKIERIGSAVL